MTIYCPRCGTANDEELKECRNCALVLSEVSSIVAGGGKDRFYLRLAVTLLVFFAVPMIFLRLAHEMNNWYFELIAGFTLVLLLPGLPWAVSAIFNRATKSGEITQQTKKS
jgi:hypothetical protein